MLLVKKTPGYTKHNVAKVNQIISGFTFSFTFKASRSTQEVHVRMWKYGSPDIAPDTIVFLGVGQSGRIPKWLARHLPPQVIIVEGIPYWHADSSEQDLEIFTTDFVCNTLSFIQNTFKTQTYNVIGHSQAAYGAVLLSLKRPQSIQNVGLLFPLGLNVRHLGKDGSERWQSLKKRTLRSMIQWEQTPFHDATNIYAGYRLLAAIRADKALFKDKFIVGVSYDLLPDVKRLTEQLQLAGRDLVIGLAGNDKLFAAHEIRDTLQEVDPVNLTILELSSATHGSIAKKSHRTFIQEFVSTVRGVKS